MSKGMQSNTSPDGTMRLAVERFQTRMESSNRQFLQDRIDEIEAMHLSTEEEKLREMRLFWPDVGIRSCPNHWSDHAPRGIIRRALEEGNVSRLEDVKTLYHELMDGIIPPTLATDEWRQMFLETAQNVCNKAAEHDEDEDEDISIPICEELGHFIKYANGVQDPDFRRSGICPWEPVPLIGIREYAFPDRPTVQPLLSPDLAESREKLKEYLKENLLDDAFIQGTVDSDLEVKVGFRTGLGSRQEHDEWYSTYLYCRRCEDDSDRSHKDWAWRVVILHADGDNPTPLYGRKPRFDSIPEFLEWYSSWMDHFDSNRLPRNVRCFYGNDDVSSDGDEL